MKTRRLWRLRMRDLLTTVVLVLVVLAFVAFAGLTWRPRAPIWERVQEVRFLGPAVAAVRSRYLPPTDVGGGRRPRSSAVADSGSPLAIQDVEYVGVGAKLLEDPRPGAALVMETRKLRDYRVVERRGSWARLVLSVIDDEEITAWVDLAAERDMSQPPLGNEPDPPKPQKAAPATAEQIAAVMETLEQPMEQFEVGGYTVLMGFRDLEVRAAVTVELRRMEALYRQRYRLEPLGEAAETVVIFDLEDSYRAFQRTAPRLAGLRSAGHSSRGLVALFRGERAMLDVAETLRHEVTHLLNSRAVGPALPPWLEEGLADELSLLSDLDPDDPFGPYRFQLGNQTLYRGPLAALRLLLESQETGDWVSLQSLLGMDWDQFVRGGRSPLLYAQSTLR